MTFSGNNFNDFLRINWPNLVHFTQYRPIGDQNTDWIDVFSLPHASLLNRIAAALHFMCVYTGCSQYAITKYWQNAVCPTKPTITYSAVTRVSRLIEVQFTGIKIGIKNPWVRRLCIPPLNDAPGWGSTLSPFLFAVQPISNCYISCHGKRECLLFAGKNVVTAHPQHTIA